MTAIQYKQLENAGTEAVKKLRLDNLRNGHPFMINAKDLPNRQSYLEYPDGSMHLVELSASGMEFISIRVLSSDESSELRKRFNLVEFHA